MMLEVDRNLHVCSRSIDSQQHRTFTSQLTRVYRDANLM